MDKEEPHDQPNEEPRETERDGEAEKRSEPEPDRRTDEHRGDQKPARGRRVGPGRGTRIHRDVDGDGLAIAVVSGTKRDEEPPSLGQSPGARAPGRLYPKRRFTRPDLGLAHGLELPRVGIDRGEAPGLQLLGHGTIDFLG